MAKEMGIHFYVKGAPMLHIYQARATCGPLS